MEEIAKTTMLMLHFRALFIIKAMNANNDLVGLSGPTPYRLGFQIDHSLIHIQETPASRCPGNFI